MKFVLTGIDKKVSNGEGLKEKPGTIFIGALGLLMIICLVNYCYVDLQMIVRHSLNLWDCLFSGNLLHFYQTACQRSIGALNPQSGEVPYDIWVYIPIAVWNLPIYIWEKATGITFEASFIALLWARLGNMLPFAASIWAVWKVTELLNRDSVSRLWACYFYAGSMLLLNGLFCLGQIDIYNAFFMLMGLAAYLKRERKKFLIWFALSITCKMFSLFVFLPLLLLMEKRILFMLRDGVAALSLSLLSKVIFFADKMKTPTQFDERRFLRMLFERRIDLSGITVSFLVLLFMALLIWCWYTELNDENFTHKTVWTAFAGYSCFFVGATTLPYWAVVFSPFIPVLMVLFPKRAKILLWLETAAGAAYFVMGLCNYGYAYAASANLRWMLAGVLNDRELKGMDFSLLYDALSDAARQNIEALLTGVFIAAVAAVLVITRPGNRREAGEDKLMVDKGSIAMRLFANSCLTFLPLLVYLLV